MRSPSHARNRASRRGFTLLELTIAVAISSILLAGMMSTVGIVLKASDTSIGPATGTREGHAAITGMCSELQLVIAISEKTATAFTVTVPDQNFDSVDDTIRYAWSGIPGDPITRQFNGGTTAQVVDDVHDFDVQYTPSVGAVEYLTLRLQIGSNPASAVRTAIPLVNEP